VGGWVDVQWSGVCVLEKREEKEEKKKLMEQGTNAREEGG